MKITAQLLVSSLIAVGVYGQTTPAAVQALKQETKLTLSQIGVSGDMNIPPDVLASISGGALEVRQQVELLTNNRLRVAHILVPPNAPNPTPAGTQTATVEDYVVRIEQTLRNVDPSSVTYVGVIDTLNAPSPFAGRTGRHVIYSIGWSGDPRTFSSASLVIPGRMATWAPTSSGTLTLVGEGTNPTDPGDENPVVVIKGAPRLVTSQSEIFLDASGSTAPGNTALTYSWRVVRGAANLINSTSPMPRVQFGGNADDYIFEVTVTNAEGKSSKGTITVFYTGRF